MPHSSHGSFPRNPLPLEWRPPWQLLHGALGFCVLVASLPLWQDLPVVVAAGLPVAAGACAAGLWRVALSYRCTASLLPAGEIRMTGGDAVWQIGAGTRVFASLVALELVQGRQRRRWWLTRASLPAPVFRELKCRLRLGPLAQALPAAHW